MDFFFTFYERAYLRLIHRKISFSSLEGPLTRWTSGLEDFPPITCDLAVLGNVRKLTAACLNLLADQPMFESSVFPWFAIYIFLFFRTYAVSIFRVGDLHF